MTQRKAVVIGFPVAHSKSPLIHNYWMKKYGLDAVYSAVALKSEELKDFCARAVQDGYVGFNVTVPYKIDVMAEMKSVSTAALKAGAVNTVIVQPDGTLRGDNTDGLGFIENVRSVRPDFNFKASTVVVLGTGGAARGVCAALSDVGCINIRNVARNNRKSVEMAFKTGAEFEIFDWRQIENALENSDLLVNATTLGMNGFDPLNIDLSPLKQTAVVADLVYAPLETELLKQAREKGLTTADGLGMLLRQAAGSFKIWFGIIPEITDELKQSVIA